jgi:methionyl-tRNA formyltransferase
MSEPCRVVIFGSFYRGFYMLNELLFGDVSPKVQVVGVCSDDVGAKHIHGDRRVWQYPHTDYEKIMVKTLAEENGLPCYTGRVNSDDFHALIEDEWKPDLCIMATFGQRIGARLIGLPQLGFYNLHPCIDDQWPSQYVGGNPFEALRRDEKTYTCVALHAIDEGYDTGPFIARTHKIAFPKETTVTDMHKITSVSAARLAAEHIGKVINANHRQPKGSL